MIIIVVIDACIETKALTVVTRSKMFFKTPEDAANCNRNFKKM